MPTIIDSLFLELGVDVSKFSKDQQAALRKIAEFESQTKRAATGARGGIQTVGDAFKDLAKESRIGASATQVENLATKFKNLGISLSAAGGAGSAVGGMARGLGMLLSPAALGVAAVSMLAKETRDFNREMTDSNALLARNAELSGMSAKNLWAMGQAVKTVGGDPAAVEASIAGLQTALAGMSIGVGNAVPQMIGMARLRRYGAHYNKGGFSKGVDEESLFKTGYAMYQQEGRAKTMALLTGYGLTSADQANLIMSSGGYAEYQKALAQAQAQAMKTGGGFGDVVKKSLESQVGLGEKDIAAAAAAETVYGGIQEPMQTVVGLLTNILAYVSKIANWFSFKPMSENKLSSTLGGAIASAVDYFKGSKPSAGPMSKAMQMLMAGGLSQDEAAATVGNMAQESSMNPLARNGDHLGLLQWDKARQVAFAKRFGYSMGSGAASEFDDQVAFTLQELRGSYRQALKQMEAARTLMGKTSAFMHLDEIVNDNSLGQRISFAQAALSMSARHVAHNDNRSEVRIGDVHLHTSADDPASFADAFRQGLSNQPLLNQVAQGTLALAAQANN